MTFDIRDPFEYVLHGDIQLRIEVWHKGNLMEECLCISMVSVVRFLKKPYIYVRETLPMMLPSDITRPGKAKLTLGFLFEEARIGKGISTTTVLITTNASHNNTYYTNTYLY